MASVAEVAAAFAAANGLIEEAQQAIHNAIMLQQQAAQMAANVVQGAGYEAAHAGLAALTQAETHLNDALQSDQAAVEQFQAYVARM